MNRFKTFVMMCLTSLLVVCAVSAPDPEPGMQVIQQGRGEEMQVATGVDWNSYTKKIQNTAPV